MMQKELIRNEILDSGYISRNQVVFHQKLGVPCLSVRSRISDLKNEGLRIEAKFGKAINKKLGENRFGDGDFIYYIPEITGWDK